MDRDKDLGHLVWKLLHANKPGYHLAESTPAPDGRLPISQQHTYLHGFNQVMQWLESAGPSGRQKFIARKLSDLLGQSPADQAEYRRGQLDAINEFLKREGTTS